MKATIIGGGVIGAGWAARFLLNGWDVALLDDAPAAEKAVRESFAAGQAAFREIFDATLPAPGELSLARSMDAALQDTDWVQESVPESLELKRQILADVVARLDPDTPVASSTSGFTPSALTQGIPDSGQILVCHPFNPVYLLPVVEVVAAPHTATSIKDKAMSTLRGIGMHPLAVRREIDAHIGDRLLEAVWREALWLVNDGVATTQEIDDVIRFGFGLRWAQMGLFETYRIAGGEAGMRRFIEHFGPALAWPWSRLTDVPELTPALIDTIASQSDAQSGGASIGELTRRRDANLVAIFKALKSTGHGVGALLNAQERGFAARKEKPQR